MRRLLALAVILSACGGVGGGAGQQDPVSTTEKVTVPSTTPTSVAATSGTTRAPSPESTTSTAQEPAPLQGLALEDVAEFDAPIEAVSADGRLFVASKEGRVWIVSEDPVELLDIRGPVRNEGEQGLLGLAFAPDYPGDPRLFVHYTDGSGTSVLASYDVDIGGESVVEGSETVLLRVAQPASNHNGGKIAFGPDGHLYVALGDGGRSNDAFGHGQRADTLLATLLRLDVSDPAAYSIPADNPFQAEGADEVWAIGLRNPWRFTFDGNFLYIADVGQGDFEEINVVPAAPAGYNFGWPITEGLHCFRPASGCSVDGLTLPIMEVAHSDAGTCSVTGGIVYRGAAIPELDGHYFYSDYCGGYLRSFLVEGGVATAVSDWTDTTGRLGSVVAFGTDPAGEMIVMTADGAVRRVIPSR